MSRKLAEGRSFFMCSHGFPSSLCSLPLSVPGANIVKGKVKSEVMRKHREVFEDREKQRRRERATDGQREAGVVVEFCVLSCRSPFPLSLLSLSGCFYSFTLSLSLVVFTLFPPVTCSQSHFHLHHLWHYLVIFFVCQIFWYHCCQILLLIRHMLFKMFCKFWSFTFKLFMSSNCI